MIRNRRSTIAALVLGLLPLAAAPPMASVHDASLQDALTRKRPSQVADAAMRGDLVAVRALLKDRADPNAAQGDGMTALHWAAESGNQELARLVLGAGANPAAATRIARHTPLHLAAIGGHSVVAGLIVDAGADVNATTTTGASALHFTATAGSGATATLLLDRGADVNAREPQWGQTPLMFAAAAGRTDVVKLLLARGADMRISGKVVDINARDKADGAESRARNARIAASRQALMANVSGAAAPAAPRGRARRDDSGNEPEPLGYAALVGSHGGLTATLLAAREGHKDTVYTLLDGGADINQVSASDGTSPLLMACINGHFDLAQRLLARGANPMLASDAGATPLYAVLNMQWAPKSRHPQPAHYMQQQVGYVELAEALLKAGSDPNARLRRSLWYTTYNRDLLGVDRSGATPFWLAAYTLDIPVMRLLLKYGADPYVGTTKVPERYEEGGGDFSGPDRSGLPPAPFGGPAVSPIHAASGVGYGLGFAGNSHRHVPDGWIPAVKFLVEELGFDVNSRDHNGYTPLHHAASRGDNALILYLVSKGADVKAVSRSGQTTVDMANGPVQRVQPYPETVALLESMGAKNNHRCVSC